MVASRMHASGWHSESFTAIQVMVQADVHILGVRLNIATATSHESRGRALLHTGFVIPLNGAQLTLGEVKQVHAS